MHPPDPLRTCRKCTPNHYDNCRGCFGWGVEVSASSDRFIPVTGGRLDEIAAALPCPDCGSDARGVPSVSIASQC